MQLKTLELKLALSLLMGQTKFWIPKSFKIIMFCTGNWYVGWRWWSMISAIYIQFINNRCWIRLLWYLSSVFKPNFTLWQYLNKQIYKLYIIYSHIFKQIPIINDLKMVEFGPTTGLFLHEWHAGSDFLWSIEVYANEVYCRDHMHSPSQNSIGRSGNWQKVKIASRGLNWKFLIGILPFYC